MGEGGKRLGAVKNWTESSSLVIPRLSLASHAKRGCQVHQGLLETRYVQCPACLRAVAYDLVRNACTVISCVLHPSVNAMQKAMDEASHGEFVA